MAVSLGPGSKLFEAWNSAWEPALKIWSPYTRLSEPKFLLTTGDEQRAGLTGSFAAIRINDQQVMISLRQVAELGLEDYSLEILCHEIGHHVFCPGNLLEAGRALAIAMKALPTQENQAPSVVNMWEDLLINDRLVRLHKQRHVEIYERLRREDSTSKLWSLYMRCFELLWGLRPGRLAVVKLEPHEEGDAHLAARMVRVYGHDWLHGVGGFAALCLPYLMEDSDAVKGFALLKDMARAGEGAEPPVGILDIGDYSVVHPSRDPNVAGRRGDRGTAEGDAQGSSASSADAGGGKGQAREPFLFGQVLQALGLKLDCHDAAVRFYREKALPHLIPFPTQETEESKEPLMEGLEPWDVGESMDEIDWMQSVLVSPKPIPGFTTVKRTWGVMGGKEREREPLDLDLYVDCSGSIPNPQMTFSYLALAGAIVVLSALRTGARVQATLWSGAGQFQSTPGFIRDEKAILRVLTGFIGGATAFPNHILVDTYSERKTSDRPVHILILSDDGVNTMAQPDNRGTPGLQISETALKKARGGGTMVLNLYAPQFLESAFAKASRAMGWELFRVTDWSELLGFAREFARKKYGLCK